MKQDLIKNYIKRSIERYAENGYDKVTIVSVTWITFNIREGDPNYLRMAEKVREVAKDLGYEADERFIYITGDGVGAAHM